MRELTVTEKDCAQQLIKYLSKYMEEAPKSFFYKMLRKKNIVLNQKKADGSEKLKTGDTIRLYLAEETIEKFRKAPEKPAAGKQVKYTMALAINPANDEVCSLSSSAILSCSSFRTLFMIGITFVLNILSCSDSAMSCCFI